MTWCPWLDFHFSDYLDLLISLDLNCDVYPQSYNWVSKLNGWDPEAHPQKLPSSWMVVETSLCLRNANHVQE